LISGSYKKSLPQIQVREAKEVWGKGDLFVSHKITNEIPNRNKTLLKDPI